MSAELKKIRVRVLENAYAKIAIADEAFDVPLRRGNVVDLVDVPCLHDPRYKSAEFPHGFPLHLFQPVDPATPLAPDFAAAKGRHAETSHQAAMMADAR